MVARKRSNGKPLENIPPIDDERASSHGDGAPALPSPKIEKAKLYRVIAQTINGTGWLPKFDVTLHAVEPSVGKLEVLRELENGVVEIIPIKKVAQEIHRYTQRKLTGFPSYQWETRHSDQAAEFWLWDKDPIPMPPAVRWSDDPPPSFSVLPWRRGTTGDTPLFDELMGRISNAKAIMAWIGSLFIPDSDRQQYVWIYGDGDDGKGALSRFLKAVFHHSYKALDTPTKDTRRFWAMQLSGLRVGVFNDCDDENFTKTGFFKALTGGDAVPIEEKGGGFFTKDILAKFLFLSNGRPRIHSKKADKKRIIYGHALPFENAPDPNLYEAELYKEGGAWLTKCIALYEALCPSKGRIPTDDEALAIWISQVEEPLHDVANRLLNFGPSLKEVPEKLWSVIKENFKTQTEQLEFMKFLERQHGVKKQSDVVDGKKCYRWKGVRCKLTPREQREEMRKAEMFSDDEGGIDHP